MENPCSSCKLTRVRRGRSKFESIVDDLVSRTLEPCKACMKDAGVRRPTTTWTTAQPRWPRSPRIVTRCGARASTGPNHLGAVGSNQVAKDEIEDVVLVGGMTRMPMVGEKVAKVSHTALQLQPLWRTPTAAAG